MKTTVDIPDAERADVWPSSSSTPGTCDNLVSISEPVAQRRRG